MSEELPRGWVTAPVSAIIEDFQPGFASGEKNVEGGVAHLRMNNIGLDGKLVLDLIRTVPDELAKPRHNLSPGDVLVCTTNSGVLVGKCAYFDLKGRYAFSNHLTRLRPKHNVIDGSFLRWNLWLHWKRGVFDDKCKHWVNQSSLPKDALLEDIVVVPPLPEQRRIVAKLEKLLGQVDGCRERLDKLPTLLKRFRQSVLAAACSGRLTADWRDENVCTENAAALLQRMGTERRERFAEENGKRKYREADPVANDDLPTVPEPWQWTNFDHCAWEITVGHVGPMKDRYSEKGVTFLRCQNVKPLKFDTNGLVYIPADFHIQLSKSELLGGEILVVRSGANTGDCCVFPRNFGASNCSDLVITRPLSGLLPEYGALYINSPAGQALLTLKQTGIAQPHFNIGAMRVKAFPLPPLAEQQEIVRRVAGLFALADQLEQRLAQARRQVDKLTPSLLARAFAGQLVPQNPDDEPAEKMLEKIVLPRQACAALKISVKGHIDFERG